MLLKICVLFITRCARACTRAVLTRVTPKEDEGREEFERAPPGNRGGELGREGRGCRSLRRAAVLGLGLVQRTYNSRRLSGSGFKPEPRID